MEILKFWFFDEKIEILKFSLFIDFFIGFFLGHFFGIGKIFSMSFRKFFRLEKIIFGKICFTTPTQKISRNPKIILRNVCDELKKI